MVCSPSPAARSIPASCRSWSQIKRFQMRATALLNRTDDSDQTDLRGVPPRPPLLRRVRAAVRGAARVVRVVDGHRRRVGLSGPVPVPVPRPPRPARVVRLAAVVHRGRRLAHLRRRDRRPAAPRAGRRRGVERAAPRHRGLGAELLRNVERTRRDRHRHPCRPGARPAGRCQPRGEGGPRSVPLLPQRDRPAHRCPAAPDRTAGPGVVELPDAVGTRRRSRRRS